MFAGTSTKAQRTAAQAWDHLASAMATAGDSATAAGQQAALVGKKAASGGKKAALGGKRAMLKSKNVALSSKAGYVGQDIASKTAGTADEAWSRASDALAVLAGRKIGRPWGLIIGVGLAGVAVGWAAASYARAALERRAEADEQDLVESAVIVTPTTGS